MVTVHGRTRQQRYGGPVDHRIILAVKQAVSVPVVANGDIVDRNSLALMLERTGADGVMVGRGALGNPWLFAELRAYLTGRQSPAPPSVTERLSTYLRHLELFLAWRATADEAEQPGKMAHRAERDAVIEMRKFAGWYLAPVPEGETLRRQINRLERPGDVVCLLQAAIARSGGTA